MLGITDISKTFYYPGAGTDIQPLLRFSYMTDTIFAPTVSNILTRKRQQALFMEKCDVLNAFYGKRLLELVDVVELDELLESESLYVEGADSIFTEDEKIDYMNAFRGKIPDRLSATRFVFKRTIGRRERVINWIHATTEGLATLLLMHQRTGMIPEIICTIQTGMMEYPDSVLVRMFDLIGCYPKLWIHGYWPCMSYDRDPVQPFPPYDATIQEYCCWNSSFGVVTDRNEDNPSQYEPYNHSYVKAFSRDEILLAEQSKTITSDRNPKREVTIIVGDILCHREEYDRMIVSEHIRNSGIDGDTRKFTTWEKLGTRKAPGLFPPLTLDESLQVAEQHARDEGVESIALILNGYEDEGACISDFLDASSAPINMAIFVKYPLDYICLTGYGSSIGSIAGIGNILCSK